MSDFQIGLDIDRIRAEKNWKSSDVGTFQTFSGTWVYCICKWYALHVCNNRNSMYVIICIVCTVLKYKQPNFPLLKVSTNPSVLVSCFWKTDLHHNNKETLVKVSYNGKGWLKEQNTQKSQKNFQNFTSVNINVLNLYFSTLEQYF